MEMKVMTYYCSKCQQNKTLTEFDWFDRKLCPKCGENLEDNLIDYDEREEE
jgi:Zn finger protein HypA/HybF involved in hydrogenase expression